MFLLDTPSSNLAILTTGSQAPGSSSSRDAREPDGFLKFRFFSDTKINSHRVLLCSFDALTQIEPTLSRDGAQNKQNTVFWGFACKESQ